ncbi:hypothetical protein [Candidatus Chrysopegis kryptomonas]|jgi:hypothetical protein|nr:hypothetical protein [Candidatus Chrysopegis kryptomonas]
MCNSIWKTKSEFLNDDNVKLVGYQKYMGSYGGGYLLFKHNSKFCGTTIAVKSAFFSDGTTSTQRLKRIIKKESGR